MNKYLLFLNFIDYILYEKGKSFKFINFIFCLNIIICCIEKNVVFWLFENMFCLMMDDLVVWCKEWILEKGFIKIKNKRVKYL